MKKRMILAAGLLLVCLSGCAYSAAKTYFRDAADYEKIWELTGFEHGYAAQSPLFPARISDLNVDEFYCRYDEQLPLGEGVQVFLRVLYAKEDFAAERERISECAALDTAHFAEKGLAAYPLQLGDAGRWEYALVDDGEKAVTYVFLYNLPRKEIEMDEGLLPLNYTDYTE